MSEHYFPCGHKVVLGHTCPVCVNAALLAALKAVEWVRLSPFEAALGEDDPCWIECPSCRRPQTDGHASDCELAAALRAAEEGDRQG